LQMFAYMDSLSSGDRFI